jgi:hypothetical protein
VENGMWAGYPEGSSCGRLPGSRGGLPKGGSVGRAGVPGEEAAGQQAGTVEGHGILTGHAEAYTRDACVQPFFRFWESRINTTL